VTYTNVYQGSHLFAVRAWDAADHVDPTEAIRAFVIDYSPPAVVLTAPASGSTVTGTIMLGARAQDNLTSVKRVKWFLDGVEIATDATGEPWEKGWNSAGVPNGTHKLIAKARDIVGNWGASRSILITVANP
jgi:leucyl aminopeptidase